MSLHLGGTVGLEVTPAKNLPEDIIHEIFKCGWSNSAPSMRLQFSLLVASVCRRWRIAALDSSSLWSTLVLIISYDPSLEILALFLSRSHSAPLDIIIITHRRVKNNNRLHREPDITKGIFRLLLPHMGRWKSLSLSALTGASLGYVNSSLRGCANVLEKLRVTYTGPIDFASPSHPQRAPFHSSFKASNLRELTLQYVVSLPDSPIDELFPALELLSLDKSAPLTLQWREFVQMLARLEHLRVFHLGEGHRHIMDLEEDPGTPPRVTLAALEELSVSDLWHENVNEMFSFFSAPRLAHFSYIDPRDWSDGSEPVIENHLEFFPALRSVTLANSRGEIDVDYDCLSQLVEHFHHVNIRGLEYAPNHVIRAAGDRQIDPTELPLARLISISLRSCLQMYVEELRELVLVRSDPTLAAEYGEDAPTALEEIRIYNDCEIGEEDRAFFTNNLRVFEWLPYAADKERRPSGSVDMVFKPRST
ncbi:hypothetical protein BKA93DRAFT_751733 [Sparassis latifolia]